MILKIKIKFQFIQFIYVKSGSKNALTNGKKFDRNCLSQCVTGKLLESSK